jgi:prepilin-type N-terminal cleavage/methylation domain-containing protein
MKYHKKRQAKKQYLNNQGFSLVEVLVCVFILAIFCIPLLRGFNMSALNNNRAHHTQMATAYAQQTLERVVAARLDIDNHNDTGGADTVDGWDLEEQITALLTDAASAEVPDFNSAQTTDGDTFRGALAAANPIYNNPEYHHLFETITFAQDNIPIGGREYNMTVTLDPLPYSQEVADPTAESIAREANVFRVSSVDDVDGLRFPVIADEINSFDGGILNFLLDTAVSRGITGLTEEQIYRNLSKEVIVDIEHLLLPASPPVAGPNGEIQGTVKVTCDVRYNVDVGGFVEEKIYNVYMGIFELARGNDQWNTGGRIYIFAKAYRDNTPGNSWGHLGNAASDGGNIMSINNFTVIANTAIPLDIYLVRGFESDGTNFYADQFRQVRVNSDNYYTFPHPNPALTGERQFSSGGTLTNLHTNIKGSINDLSLPVDPNADAHLNTVGTERPRLRNYVVTVTLRDTDGRLVAEVTTTKRVV